MPFNGSGNFTLLYNWQTDAANGLNISSVRMEAQDADIAGGLSMCLTKDGQQTPTADLQMGGYRLKNLGNANTLSNAATAQDVQNHTLTTLTGISGTDTISATISPTLASYGSGQEFSGIAAGPNTTNAVTLNIDILGAKPVVKYGSLPLAPGDLQGAFRVKYDGVSFQLLNPVPLNPPAGALTLTEPGNGNGTLTINGASDSNGANIKLVGNGTTTPNKFVRAQGGQFQVVNSAYATPILTVDDAGNTTAAGNLTASSDERLKKDWGTLPSDFLERLAGVEHGTYTRINHEHDGRHVGVSAQSLRSVLPEAVPTGPDGFLGVVYGNAALVAVIQLTREVLRLRALLEPVK